MERDENGEKERGKRREKKGESLDGYDHCCRTGRSFQSLLQQV